MDAWSVGFSHRMKRESDPGVSGLDQSSRPLEWRAMYAALFCAAIAGGSSLLYTMKSLHPSRPKWTRVTLPEVSRKVAQSLACLRGLCSTPTSRIAVRCAFIFFQGSFFSSFFGRMINAGA